MELTFTPRADGTVVRLEQTGWDKLGEPAASTRRESTGHAWSAITARYATTVAIQPPE